MNKPAETEEQKKQREAIQSIANNISALAKAVAALLGGPLNKRALLVLLASSSKESQSTVDKVLTAIHDLEKDWLRKP